jgi:hypothetical protein
MALNFNLLNTETPGQIATSVMRGYEGAQKLAQDKETNALNLKIKKEELDTFRQDRQKLLEFRDQMAKVGKNGTVRQISDTFLGSGIPEQMKLGIELRKEVEKHDRLAKALGEPTSDELFATAPSAPVAPAMPGTLGSGTFGMAPEPMAAPANALMPTAAPSAPANALMPTPAPAKRVLTTEDKINNLIRGGFTEEARILQAQQTALNREDKLSGDAAVMQQLGYPLTREGYAAFKAVSRAPSGGGGNGGGRAPSGYRFTTSGELEAIPGGPAAAPAVVPMTELQQRKADKERVDELQGVKAAKSTADELEKLTDELAGNPAKNKPPHPGYEKIIGIQANIPSLPGGDAKQAEQKLETFKGKIATFGRQLATQYGKLGNMALGEWKIVSDSIQNINPAAGNLDEQMRDVVRLARDFEKSMQEKYDGLYGNNSQQPATPAATGNLSPSEQAELDQLRKKFGK